MFDLETYVKAGSLAEALELLQDNPSSIPIAGGTDVLVRLREGSQDHRHLVDIHELAELNFIEKESDGTIRIGAGIPFNRLIEHPLILEHLPILVMAGGWVGGPQVRNSATIGGNICNAAPCADSASPLLVLGATAHLDGPKGKRSLPLKAFFAGPYQVNKGRAEILTHFSIAPENYTGWSGVYIKYTTRGAMDIATIGCGVNLKVSENRVEKIRLAYTVAAPKPIRCFQTEAAVQGLPADASLMEAVASNVLDDLSPRDSWRASKDFREHIIRELAKRTLRQALSGAGGAIR